jgi:hypothetical protein
MVSIGRIHAQNGAVITAMRVHSQKAVFPLASDSQER